MNRDRRKFGLRLTALGWLGAVVFLAAADLPEQLILPTGGPEAAANLVAKPDCDSLRPGRAIAKLGWTSAKKPGREQRVVVTIYREGFQRGTFEFSPPLAADATNYVWDRIKGQAIHRWKVLTLQPQGWVASGESKFRGPTCVQDVVPGSVEPGKGRTNEAQLPKTSDEKVNLK